MKTVFLLDQNNDLYDQLSTSQIELYHFTSETDLSEHLDRVNPDYILLREGEFTYSLPDLINSIQNLRKEWNVSVALIRKDNNEIKFIDLHKGSFFVQYHADTASMISQLFEDHRPRFQDKEFAEILSTLTHDLKGPLSSIKLGTRMLSLCSESSQAKYIDAIQSACKQQQLIIDTMIDWFRIESGSGYEHTITDIDLNVFFSDIVHENCRRFAIANKELVLISQFSDECLKTDEMLLQRVLNELVENALKYSLPHTQSNIQCEYDKHYLHCCVSNQTSLRIEEVPRLFRPFIRGSNSSGSPGTGLGLYVLDRLLKAAGGSLDVHVDNTVIAFTVNLPIYD